MVSLTIVVGVVREIFWGLPVYNPEHITGAVPIHHGSGIVMGATILIVLRAFANGGSSLTGVEAISNTVNCLPQARRHQCPSSVLTVMACVLAFLLAGVAWLAHITHAIPYANGYPSMLSEIARAVFGNGAIGKAAVLSDSGGDGR